MINNTKARSKKIAIMLLTSMLVSNIGTPIIATATEVDNVDTRHLILNSKNGCTLSTENEEVKVGDIVTINVDISPYFNFEGVEVKGVTTDEYIEYENTSARSCDKTKK